MLYKDDVDWSSGIGYARSGIDGIGIMKSTRDWFTSAMG